VTLTNKAVLEIDFEEADRTGVFELRGELEVDTPINRSYLVGGRGAQFRGVVEQGTDLIPGSRLQTDPARRRNYYLDAGGGSENHVLSFEHATEASETWGDRSGNTRFDGTGDGRWTAKQVFDHYVGQAKMDSRGTTRLHLGEWTDGSHSASAGRFGRPMAITILESTTSLAVDDPSAFSGEITCARLATLPDVDLDGAIDDIEATLADLIPDF